MNQPQPNQYHIYGRKSYEQPLTFVMATDSPVLDSLGAPAGEEWIEVVAFPTAAVIQVFPRESKQIDWREMHANQE